MRWICIAITVCVFASALPAEDNLRQAQVAAATANAMASLEEQIANETIAGNVTVREFLQKTNSTALMGQMLREAEQIGGPRWLDGRICQVRLELNGSRIAAMLQKVAADHPDRLPIAPGELNQRLAAWNQRIFSTMGTSAAAGTIQFVRPPEQKGPWSSVPEKTCRKAVAAARANAIRSVQESVAGISLDQKQTLADALRQPEFGKGVQNWLESRPISRIDFRDTMDVHVTLAVKPEDFADALRLALQQHKDLPQPADEQHWLQFRAMVIQRMVKPSGQTAVVSPKAVPAVQLPNEPPRWVFQQIDAEGTARQGPSKLISARQAEQQALKNLHDQLMTLPLTGELTLGQATQRDPKIAAAIRQCVPMARTFKVDYNRPDGTVMVKVSLELRLVWDQIHRVP